MSQSPYTLCICAHIPGHAKLFADLIGSTLFSSIILSDHDPLKELEEVKISGKKVVLVILGPLGHAAIKFLCDDFNKPDGTRRVAWIHSLSTGVDWYQLDTLKNEINGIPFTTGHGSFALPLAEHVIYSMLYFNRQTWRLQSYRAATHWEQYNMLELRGQKLGVIGYGDIGQTIARRARAFGMEVTGVKRSKPSAAVDKDGVHLVHGEAECNRVLSESDFVVGVLPGTEETKQYFNKQRFQLMKPSAVFINIGRGITQCENDLIEALRNGVIAGTALDVFEKEPLPKESGLWTFGDDKVLLSYHTADRSANFLGTSVSRFLSFIDEYLTSGQVSGYSVDFRKGY